MNVWSMDMTASKEKISSNWGMIYGGKSASVLCQNTIIPRKLGLAPQIGNRYFARDFIIIIIGCAD